MVLALIGLLLVESVLYGAQTSVPFGPFRLNVAGQSVRLPELFIPAALLGRLLVRGFPHRISATGLWWLAFAAWLGTAVIVGLLRGHPPELVLFEGKAILYVTGAMALAAGVPAKDYVHGRGLVRIIMWAAALAAMVSVAGLLRINAGWSPVDAQGGIDADAQTLFFSFAVLAIALGPLGRSSQRLSLTIAALALLAAPLMELQRAAATALIASVAVIAIASISRAGRLRIAATPTEAVLVLAAVASLAALPLTLPRLEGSDAHLPLVQQLRQAFVSEGKEQSAQSRINQWGAVQPVISEHPVLGHGLGVTYRYFEVGANRFIASDLTHNIGLDLLLRAGVVGLLLFVVASSGSIIEGFTVWRQHHDDARAFLALGCTAILVGLLTKGMVESIFEKYRIAVLLGILLGIIRSTTASLPVADPSLREPTGARLPTTPDPIPAGRR